MNLKDLSRPVENTHRNEGNPQACMCNTLENTECYNIQTPTPVMTGIIMDTTGDGPSLEISVEVKGRHPTLGLIFSQDQHDTTILQKCNPGTPAARIPKWRQHLRNAKCRKINETDINTYSDIKQEIS